MRWVCRNWVAPFLGMHWEQQSQCPCTLLNPSSAAWCLPTPQQRVQYDIGLALDAPLCE